MARAFAVLTVLSLGLYVYAIVLGQGWVKLDSGVYGHLLVGLGAGILAVCLHCLVFAIFTGSGKDARLLVEDLKLDPKELIKIKQFKRTVFPPALYAILATLLTTSMGGIISSGGSKPVFFYTVHGILAWVTLVYNAKVFWVEVRAIAENSRIIFELNRTAARVLEKVPKAESTKVEDNFDLVPDVGTLPESEFGRHAYALGKFLSFMSYNAWLPYIYLRYIVGWLEVSVWPFLTFSVLSFFVGIFLRQRYSLYRPQRYSPPLS